MKNFNNQERINPCLSSLISACCGEHDLTMSIKFSKPMPAKTRMPIIMSIRSNEETHSHNIPRVAVIAWQLEIFVPFLVVCVDV